MKRHFIVYQLNHTILLVDLTGIGLPNEIYPSEGKDQMVSSRRFQSWKSAEAYLRQAGATGDDLEHILVQMKKTQIGVLTIQ
jgi:hypothetical protein